MGKGPEPRLTAGRASTDTEDRALCVATEVRVISRSSTTRSGPRGSLSDLARSGEGDMVLPCLELQGKLARDGASAGELAQVCAGDAVNDPGLADAMHTTESRGPNSGDGDPREVCGRDCCRTPLSASTRLCGATDQE